LKNETTYLKNYYTEKIAELSSQYANEKKQLIDMHNKQLTDTSSELSKAMQTAKDVNLAKTMLSKHQQCIERLQEVVQNQELEITCKQKEIDRLTQEVEILTNKLTDQSAKLLKVEESNKEKTETLESLQNEYEKERKSAELKVKESEDMKKQAEKLLEQVQVKIGEDDNMVDRRLVTTFLVNYLNEDNTEKMRYQMLRPLAEMLGMSKEQRQKIGLDQDPGLLAQFTNFLVRG
jgi:chromosome segregation ATPase